jgi:DNA cross-link repair 1C protein
VSTFNGKVKEFPDIRIDHFRSSGGDDTRLPLALFLSHVHSDHLEGLESCKSPFIYCSPATKEILLRLEKYPHRMNFAKGILEARKQTYKHLRKLLKTITLFDANHCVGAVMFLIEGDGKAILYTGDIRSELWWVNNLARHPLMLAYVSYAGNAPLKQLDCIYLDTTFANKQNPYKHFPSKAEGTLELLQKVSRYPKDTVFYFDTWTFGYEDVWMALCSVLNCQVHVDDYRYKLYRALATGEGIKAEEAARLFGYNCGNHTQEGCLTRRQTRVHSCEQGTGCEIFKKGELAPQHSSRTC